MRWDDYSNELVPDAKTRTFSMFGVSGNNSEPISDVEKEELINLIKRTKRKFAWTYARTYPHEYTTMNLCSPDDHARLIECIERFGVIERFGKIRRRYFHFEERKSWHMGDPKSSNPEEWPNVINRTWIDVRRHADHVRHVWTAEEVELQMRLWEIQLETTTDRRKHNNSTKNEQ